MVVKSDHSHVLSDTLVFPVIHLLCTSHTLTLAPLEYGFSRLGRILRIVQSNCLVVLQFPLGHVCQSVTQLYLSIFRDDEISVPHPAFISPCDIPLAPKASPQLSVSQSHLLLALAPSWLPH